MSKLLRCTRRLQFCHGHRVVEHESKCRNLHGHNYVALITAAVPKLDSVGRVLDFGFMKSLFGGWVDTYLDHRMVLWSEDRILDELPEKAQESMGVVRVNFNPTAENLAEFLRLTFLDLLTSELHAPRRISAGLGAAPRDDVRITRVRLWETENCYADAEE